MKKAILAILIVLLLFTLSYSSGIKRISGGNADTIADQGVTTHLGGNNIQITVVNTGAWDMDTVPFITVDVTGLTSATMLGVNVFIVSDDNPNLWEKLDSYYGTANGNLTGGISSLAVDDITIARTTGQKFDNTSYNDSTINRGRIVIMHYCAAC